MKRRIILPFSFIIVGIIILLLLFLYGTPLNTFLLRSASCKSLSAITGMSITSPSYIIIVKNEGEEIAIYTQTATKEGIQIIEEEASKLVFKSPERVTISEGFFYQPITEDVKERIYGLSYKENCTVPYEDLNYVGVLYVDFDGNTQSGEIVCNKKIARDLAEIFKELYENEYAIDKIRLVDEYNADDDLSCLDNNTSCFNFRVVGGTNNLSKHALGLAIDINPFYNPYVTYPDGVERISPPGSEPYGDRSADFPHKIDYDDLCYQLFTAHGFTWGGDWKTLKDYQHFQKE